MINVEQGDVGLTNTTIKTNVIYGSVTIVNFLRFRNPAAYTLTLSRYSKKANRTDVVYQYALSAGDTIVDTTQYILNYGDVLYVRSSVTGTIYVANTQ
jgi:hypothetical protein